MLLKAATEKNHYGYYHLLSGFDLPLKNQDTIHMFFESHQGKEFVGFSPIDKSKYLRRVSKYWFYNSWRRNNNPFIRFIGKISTGITIFMTHRNCDFEFKFGSNWFSITDMCARYIVSNSYLCDKRFKHTLCADELFVQTVMWENPELMKNVYDISNEYRSCMRKVDWKRGNPYTWRSEDFDELMYSDKLFARKFDERVDNEIIEKLISRLSCKNEKS